MPPKARNRSPSPAKKPAAKSGAKAAPKAAGSKAVASASAKPKAAAKTATTAAAKNSPATSGSAKVTPDVAATFLQRVGRGFVGRRSLGPALTQAIKARLEVEGKRRLEAFDEADTERRSVLRKVKKSAEDREAARKETHEAMCLAAFDGDLAGLRRALGKGANVMKPDPQGNYALGEAAVAGQTEAAQILLDAGADPNSRGEYGRTPLWRAAFNSHADTIKLLLEHGADPRVSAQSQLPLELASGAAKTALEAWDVSKTDRLKAEAEKRTQAILDRMAKEQADAMRQYDEGVSVAREKLTAAQREARATRAELEDRIVQLDTVRLEPDAGRKAEIALEAVKDCEARVAATAARLEEATKEFLAARAAQKAEGAAAAGDGAGLLDDEDKPTIEWSEIAALAAPDWARRLMITPRVKRPDGSTSEDALWPLLIDVAGKAAVYFRYRDVNLLDTFRPKDLEPETVRRALLGALRYGKPLVIDMRDACLWDFVEDALAKVRPGLWADVIAGRVRQPEVYLPLVKPEDGPRYDRNEWRDDTTAQFTIVFLTTADAADELSPEGLFPVRTPTG